MRGHGIEATDFEILDLHGTAAEKNTSSVFPPGGNNDIRVASRFAASVMCLPGYTGGAQDTTAVANYITARNNVNDVSVSTGLPPGSTFTNTSGSAACALP